MLKSPSINLYQLLDEKKPIYVYNSSNNPRGIVTVIVFRPNGSPFVIPIKKTWIPICMTDYCTHEALRNSDDFRKNLTQGLIQLVDQEEAEKILSEEDAQEELIRLNLSQYGSYDGTPPKSNLQVFSDQASQVDQVKITVKEILLRDVSLSEKYHLLRSSEDSLNADDYKYIVANSSGKVLEWAQKHLE